MPANHPVGPGYTEPKVHRNGDNNLWCVLDKNETPFWTAWFLNKEEAETAWAIYEENILAAEKRGRDKYLQEMRDYLASLPEPTDAK